MNPQFTHFSYAPTCGIDLLVGDAFKCSGCGVTLYRDFVCFDEGGEVVADEPNSEEGQLALGRIPLPEGAEPAAEEQTLCESCSIEAGLL